MSELTIYHNPRCSKSREALAIIKASGAEIKIVDYLKKPPTYAELKDLLVKLNMKPEEIIRKGEAIYKEKFMAKKFGPEEWIQIMTEYPVLIERPIIVRNNKAVIGRSEENVLDILKK